MPILDPAHALIMAISRYPNERDALPPDCVAEARQLGGLLTEHGGYSGVTMLCEEEATKPKIMAALGELAGCDAEATILLYFMGHGADRRDLEQPSCAFVAMGTEHSGPSLVSHPLGTAAPGVGKRIPASGQPPWGE